VREPAGHVPETTSVSAAPCLTPQDGGSASGKTSGPAGATGHSSRLPQVHGVEEAPQPVNGKNGNYGGPKVRDRLYQLIRHHQLAGY
jgi:hypothetical protein